MNDRAGKLIDALNRVRALTVPQAMSHVGIEDVANWRRFLSPLIDRGLVRPVRALAKPVPELREPLFRWPADHAGEVEDARFFSGVIRLARRRWSGFSASPVRVLIASKKAGMLCGTPRTGSLVRPLQATHDLTLAGVFTHLVKSEQIQTEDWVGEEAGDLRIGRKSVDALLIDQTTKGPRTAIECVGGDYSEDKLFAIHRECQARGLPYELW